MEREFWNSKVIEKNGEFLQSWDWGEFQKALGKRVIRFYDENFGLAQIIITQLPFGLSWSYVPRGPIFFNSSREETINKIIEILPKNSVFVHFELADEIGFDMPRFKSRQPEKTLVLDLTKSIDEILDNMNSKNRYSIRIAQKMGLEFKELDDKSEFYKILKLTSQRQKFNTYPKSYFDIMCNSIDSKELKFFGVFKDKEILASAVFYCFGNRVFYLHSGSDHDKRSLMAPYFLQWESMKFFKNIGMEYYDFWGIDEKRWPGVSRFKMRFGGRVKEYPGSRVKILKPFWFGMYKIAKRC